jgi:hypothetical protein
MGQIRDFKLKLLIFDLLGHGHLNTLTAMPHDDCNECVNSNGFLSGQIPHAMSERASYCLKIVGK